MEDAGHKARGFVRDQAVLIASCVLALFSMVLVPPSADYLDYINFDTLFVLFCLMAAVAGMRWCNALGVLAHTVLERRMTVRTLSLLLVALPFVCSMFVTNDVALIAFVPFTITVLNDIGRRDLMIPVIALQTVAANLGSMTTPFGSPQNIFVMSEYAPSLGAFLMVTVPLVLIGLVPLLLMTMRTGTGPIEVSFEKKADLEHKPFLGVCVVLFVIAVLAVMRVIPSWVAVVVTVAAFLILKPRMLAKVDYSLLLTFVFMFVFAGNVASVDAVKDTLVGLTDWNCFLSSAGLSQVVSNVPAIVTLAGFTGDWQGLLAGTNVGGFGTPIASMASIISLKLYMSVKGSDPVRYLEHSTAYNLLMLVFLVPAGLLLLSV